MGARFRGFLIDLERVRGVYSSRDDALLNELESEMGDDSSVLRAALDVLRGGSGFLNHGVGHYKVAYEAIVGLLGTAMPEELSDRGEYLVDKMVDRFGEGAWRAALGLLHNSPLYGNNLAWLGADIPDDGSFPLICGRDAQACEAWLSSIEGCLAAMPSTATDHETDVVGYYLEVTARWANAAVESRRALVAFYG